MQKIKCDIKMQKISVQTYFDCGNATNIRVQALQIIDTQRLAVLTPSIP